MNSIEIGKRIKDKRLELGLTQAAVYTKTGISTGNLSDIERGVITPSASALCKFSEIFKCSIDYILLGKSYLPDDFELLDQNQTLSPLQEIILTYLNKLDSIDQEEILDIIEMKILRKKHLARLANSRDTSTSENV